MITQITAIDRGGLENNFTVSQEPKLEKGLNGITYSGITYKVGSPSLGPYKYFEFIALDIPQDRILIFMVINHDIPELQNKGIVKSMIKALSIDQKKDIVSSTNNDSLKISISEGRIHEMTTAWKKWMTEFKNISYLTEEDRFIFRFLS